MDPLKHVATQVTPSNNPDDVPVTPARGPNDLFGYLKSVASDKVGVVVLQIATIDCTLGKINMLMSRLQPWHSGRVGITIENRGGYLTVPRPKVYTWRRELVKWAYIRHAGARFAQKVKTSRAFHENQEVVKELCRMTSDLMKARAGLVLSVSNFAKSVDGRMKSSGAKHELFVTRLDTIQDEIDAKKHCIDFSAWKIDDPE